MCKIKCPISRFTEFTGYKVVIKHEGKYYSPATGIEYKPGPVPKLTDTTERSISMIRVFADDFMSFYRLTMAPFFNHSFNGLTSVFVEKKDAEDLLELFKDREVSGAMIVKITVTDNLYDGFASTRGWSIANASVIAGKTIVRIEEEE